MGTRADFYIGTGPDAQWLGSVGWDGDEWAEEEGNPLAATTEDEFRAAVEGIAKERDDFTHPSEGWPWPWDTSKTTDYVYYFLDGKVSTDDRNDWPNMSHLKNVTMGNKSGLIVIVSDITKAVVKKMQNFEFELDQKVVIVASSESGLVVGRAEYSVSENSYLIRYKAGDGRAVESWWGESALIGAAE